MEGGGRSHSIAAKSHAAMLVRRVAASVDGWSSSSGVRGRKRPARRKEAGYRESGTLVRHGVRPGEGRQESDRGRECGALQACAGQKEERKKKEKSCGKGEKEGGVRGDEGRYGPWPRTDWSTTPRASRP